MNKKERREKNRERKESIRLREGRDYESRQFILQELGYSSYTSYLASDLWKSIRSKAFLLYGELCILCGKRATEIHHLRYHRNDLLGTTLNSLRPVCRDCHQSLEYDGQRKLDMKQVNRAFEIRLEASIGLGINKACPTCSKTIPASCRSCYYCRNNAAFVASQDAKRQEVKRKESVRRQTRQLNTMVKRRKCLNCGQKAPKDCYLCRPCQVEHAAQQGFSST